MSERKRFVLISDIVRQNALNALRNLPLGWTVTLAPKQRSADQNNHFHALCADMAASGIPFAGKPRNADQWKVLFISGHAVATNTPGEVIPGLEGEFVAIRESSATMGVGRASSLIDYTLAYMADHGVEPRGAKYMGYAA